MDNEKKRCTRCVLSEAFPKIEFDEMGVCNYCRDEFTSQSEEKAIENSKEKVLSLIQGNKGKYEYDAIMCYSGGKDSTYTLMLAINKYGLKVLSFTLDNGFLSNTAFENINRVVESLGVDHITVKPSSVFYKSVIRASLLNDIYNPKTLTRISSGCNSCISLVNITALKMAIDKNIPMIFSGFTLGQIPLNSMIYKNNYAFFQESREPSLNKLREYVGPSVDDYYCLRQSTLDRVSSYPLNINLLCLEDISEDQIVRDVEVLGWKKPTDVDGCSSNCRLNTLNNYIHMKKFGYSPYELELSHLIRKGQLSRESALDKLNDQPEEQLKYLFNELEINI